MLPAPHRLRDAEQYRAVLRDKRAGRAGGSLLVVHVIDADASSLANFERVGPRVGFVVSKAVGNAVVRSRTKRVLRHLVLDELPKLNPALDIVVRANPAIAGQSTQDIRTEWQRMLTKAQKRLHAAAAPRGTRSESQR